MESYITSCLYYSQEKGKAVEKDGTEKQGNGVTSLNPMPMLTRG